jgi:MoxR-like ATPase
MAEPVTRSPTLQPVVDAAGVEAMVHAVRRGARVALRAPVHRRPRRTRLGRPPPCVWAISPRATLHLLRAGRAHAALRGRDHVLPDDIKAIAIPVLAHRVILSGESQLSRRSAADVLSDLLDRTRVPAQPR